MTCPASTPPAVSSTSFTADRVGMTESTLPIASPAKSSCTGITEVPNVSNKTAQHVRLFTFMNPLHLSACVRLQQEEPR
jgi:hypothetical protein